jgi:Helix-turn-helix domain of resolvase
MYLVTQLLKFGRKPKRTSQQLTHAHKLIEDGQRREDVAGLFKVSCVTLYRRLLDDPAIFSVRTTLAGSGGVVGHM